jgi:N-acetylmuramoyl-L-alanine amidase
MNLTLKYIISAFFVLLLSSNFSFSQSNQKFKVVLDAGHGAHDFGAVYHGNIEKNIALEVVLKVGKLLEKNPNIEVIYTRKSDVFIDLIERANIANRASANIFVSIHCNANKNIAASGTETYVMGLTKNASNLEAAKKENSVITLEKDYKQKYEGFDPNSPESTFGITIMQEEYLDNSIALAGLIQENFKNILGLKDRGVKQAPFMVLHKAYMPRILIEMGFISNVDEGSRLNSEDGQLETAQSIANAIVQYKKDFYGEGSNEPVIEKPTPKKIEKPVDTPKTPTVTPTTIPKNVEPAVEKPVEPTKGIVFRVQLSASAKKLDLTPSNFNGLKNVTSTFENKLYKYYFGSTSNYEEAKKFLQEAKSKGYTTAYIIALKDGKSISVKDAIK